MTQPSLLYREPYPGWIMLGMDVLAMGILLASFRDAWAVVGSLGPHPELLTSQIVAAAVVLAIDASILLLEQVRSQIKLRAGNTRTSDVWVGVLIFLSAVLNVRYLTAGGEMIDRVIGLLLGIAIPTTIAVLGYLKGNMLAYNHQVLNENKEARTKSTQNRERLGESENSNASAYHASRDIPPLVSPSMPEPTSDSTPAQPEPAWSMPASEPLFRIAPEADTQAG